MSEELTFTAEELREQASEALESGDIEGAMALAANADDTEAETTEKSE